MDKPFRISTVFLAIIVAQFGLTLAGLVYFLKTATAEASVGLLFSPALYWWLFALFALAWIPTRPNSTNKSACHRAGNPLKFSGILDRPCYSKPRTIDLSTKTSAEACALCMFVS